MVKYGLLVRVEAKKGKEAEVERFLAGALPLAQQETGTTAWFAMKLGPSTFGIFDVFPDEAGRSAPSQRPDRRGADGQGRRAPRQAAGD